MKNGWNSKLAFVLSGAVHGAHLQVGALRALIEAGYHPELVTGTSIGAANAAFLAVHGYTLAGIEKLEKSGCQPLTITCCRPIWVADHADPFQASGWLFCKQNP
jgi:predicted acylesterase/phospholipase RssA